MIILESRTTPGLWIQLYTGKRERKQWQFVDNSDDATRLTHKELNDKLREHRCPIGYTIHDLETPEP